MSITILPYSSFCPENNYDEDNPSFIITIIDEININIDNQFTVFSADAPQLNTVFSNKVYFNINNNTASKSVHQTITIPKGTRYFISDKTIDKICLVHRFEIDQNLIIKSNTKIKILENTNLTLLKSNLVNFALSSTSEFYVN
jgi:hypothetical protein